MANMRRAVALCGALLLIASVAAAQAPSTIPSYYDQVRFNLTSPSAVATPSGGFANPAIYGVTDFFSGQFSWSDDQDRFGKATEWGAFASFYAVGFGIIQDRTLLEDGTSAQVQDLRIALVDRMRNTSIGLAYGWSEGDTETFNRSRVFQAGFVHRIGRRFLKFGAVGTFGIGNKDLTGLFDIALRPVGKWLTLYADTELPRGTRIADAAWSSGAVVRPFRGLSIGGRYFSDQTYSVAIGFGFYGFRLTGAPHYDSDFERTGTTYDVRF